MPNVHVHYFALLREQRGLSHEMLTTTANDVAALYAELAQRHAFSLTAERVRAAVQGEFVPWTHPLREGDEVVFIPPVAGG